jgi:hypothetical protein
VRARLLLDILPMDHGSLPLQMLIVLTRTFTNPEVLPESIDLKSFSILFHQNLFSTSTDPGPALAQGDLCYPQLTF